jgi:outer membrane protein assembly factor BamB
LIFCAFAGDTSLPPKNALSQAPMTVANGVVYYASMDAKGTLFYLEAATGRLLGSFETGATLGCGPSLARGKVFVGALLHVRLQSNLFVHLAAVTSLTSKDWAKRACMKGICQAHCSAV